MKISNQENRQTIKCDRIHFISFNEIGEFIPKSVKFKLDYFGNELSIQGISVNDWFKLMLENKLIVSTHKLLPPHSIDFIKNGQEGVLLVENIELEYIAKTLFLILQQLLPEIQLNYLEYD